jgi:hypothetical protein
MTEEDKMPEESKVPEDVNVDAKQQKRDEKAATAQAKLDEKKAKLDDKKAKADEKKAKKEADKQAKKEAKDSKKAPTLKRIKRKYAHEKNLAGGSPEAKSAFLFLLIIAILVGGVYGRFLVLNPQLAENRQLLKQIPELMQRKSALTTRGATLRQDVAVVKADLDRHLGATASTKQVEPKLTKYLYVLQRFQINCEQYSLSHSDPVMVANQPIGLIEVNLSYECKGPYLPYLQAMTQLQELGVQIKVTRESISRIDGTNKVAVNGQLSFVVKENE